MLNFLKKRKVVVTHSGGFHTDDVFAVATLSLYYDGRIKIIRTRDPKIIEQGDIVLDVGEIYDPVRNRFDHHQIGGAENRENGIPYASFGLIWKHFGLKLCDEDQEAYKFIDEKICTPIDASDNGFDVDKETLKVKPFDIGAIVGAFKPVWENEDDEEKYEQFKNAVNFAKGILKREIENTKHELKGRKIVEEAYQNSRDKKIIEIKERIPRIIFQSVLSNYEEPLFFISPSKDLWKAEAIRKNMNTFESRSPFKTEFAGRKNEELAKISGVGDALFCHRNAFLCTAKSREGVLKLIEESLK